MKNVITVLLILILNSYFSQCNVTITTGNTSVPCGSDINLYATGISGNQVMNNDFDLGNAGTGWNVTTAATFTNPCRCSAASKVFLEPGNKNLPFGIVFSSRVKVLFFK